MNCQDITRLIDSGKFSAMNSSEQRDAETHAHSCRHCAPLWFAHARLAAERIPAMPPELSVRCLTLAAAEAAKGAQTPSSRRVSRTMMVVGGLIVLAAAASMLMVNVANAPAPQARQVVVAVAAPVPAEASVSVSTATPTPAAPFPEVKEEFPSSLPLLPAPLRADAERKAQVDLVTRKALELYPELTQGPEIEGIFIVSLALRADGTVLNKSLSIAANTNEANEQMHAMKPLDGSQTFMGWPKGAQVNKQTLRGGLTVAFSVVPNTFDVSRSDLRVQEIVHAGYDHLLMPMDKGGRNTLTVLLSENGVVQRESVEFISDDELRQPGAQKSADTEARAQDLARRLGVGVDQIGLMGSTYIQGSASDPADRRVLMVNYAWTRRAGEAAPAFRQSNNSSWGSGIDMAAALVIVERLIPEAFIKVAQPANEPAGPPTTYPIVILTVEGRVIATGTMNVQRPTLPQFQQIAPGVEVGTNISATVRNSAGMTAAVQFAWEATPGQKEAAEKQRLAAPAK